MASAWRDSGNFKNIFSRPLLGLKILGYQEWDEILMITLVSSQNSYVNPRPRNDIFRNRFHFEGKNDDRLTAILCVK